MKVKVNGPVIKPLRYLIRDVRKLLKEATFFKKDFITAALTFLKRCTVEFVKFAGYIPLKLLKRILNIVPAACDDSRSYFSNRTFHGWLLLGFLHTGRHYGGHVV